MPRLLHVFSTFDLGGPQARAVQLMNAWGQQFSHLIVSVSRGELAARDRIAPGVAAEFPTFPDLKSGSLAGRLWAVRKRVRELRPDLILTYNWGAVEVVMSMRLFGEAPVVHHEDGFGPDEAGRLLWRRNLFRRAALPGASHVVVASKVLEWTAREIWKVPSRRLSHIPNGVDIALFDQVPSPSALPGFDRADGVLQVGCVAGLRKEKNLPRLVRIFAAAARDLKARLMIVGTGAKREADAIMDEARRQDVAGRVHLLGFLPEPHRYVGLFDVFALTSDTEQFPISLVEAMAAARPAVCTSVGDIRDIVAPPNLAFVCSPDDEQGLAAALRKLLLDPQLRQAVGDLNRSKVRSSLSLDRMTDRYLGLYRAALRAPRPTAETRT